jgi:ATP-dependent Clp protease ATP-binding subunit ClpC
LAQINFKLPVLVRDVKIDGKTQYYLKPLFIPFPIAVHPRFSKALSQLRQEVKVFFRGFKLNRTHADRLFWFLFSPDFTYRQIQLDFKLGRDWVSGLFSVVDFSYSGYTFIYLPQIQHYMFIPPQDTKGVIDFEDQVKKAVKNRLQKIKHENPGNFIAADYFASKKEFVTQLPIKLNIEQGDFKYEQESLDSFFAFMADDEQFDGATEVEKVGFDYNSLFPDDLGRAFERDKEVERLKSLLYNQNNVPIALVGPEGVGKHSILGETVYRYLSDPEKRGQRKQNIWHLNPNRIIAGMSIVGYWQKRLEAIIDFIRFPEGKKKLPDKLLFDNPIALLTVGKSTGSDLTFSDIIKPYLEKRSLQVMLIATIDEWKIVQEKNRGFASLFQVVRLQPPDTETAVKIVLQKRKHLELEHNLSITINAISQLLDLHRNFLKNNALPGSIIKILTQLASGHRFGIIDAPQVRDAFRNMSGLDRQLLEKNHTYQKGEIRDALKARLIGQEDAVNALADAIHLTKAKLTDSGKPQSSFLFIGPTGVGKTEAAKAICQYLMSDEQKLMRFDMNEFIDSGAAQRLTGTAMRPEGLLTGKLRYNPFGILLFDEIEKAHPDVHDLLLQILDDGRLTDGAGRTVDFCNTIIIMTSNIGAGDISRALGFGKSVQDIHAIYTKAVENFFRPELINRIDKIVIFNALKPDHITRIAQLQIKDLLKRDGFVQRTTILNISKEALAWVSERGYDPKMGGRALKRQIENDLTRLSAEHLVSADEKTPIIFHVLLRNGQLEPLIEPLEFCNHREQDWLPDKPNYTENPRPYYKKLQSAIQKLERQVNRVENQEAAEEDSFGSDFAAKNWAFYHFKERVTSLREEINNKILSISGQYRAHSNFPVLRIKKANLSNIHNVQSPGKNDKFIQEKSLEELSRHLNQLNPLFDSISSEFIDHFINLSAAGIQSKYFSEQSKEKITIEFESLILGRGSHEINFLAGLYENLLQTLDIQFDLQEEENKFTAEGFGLYELLKSEDGIQLFYSSHLPPLPIRMRVNSTALPSDKSNTIFRLFYNGQTLLDLRTGFLNPADMTPAEFKLIWLGGVKNNGL